MNKLFIFFINYSISNNRKINIFPINIIFTFYSNLYIFIIILHVLSILYDELVLEC